MDPARCPKCGRFHEPERYVNYTNHGCGCRSRFDTEAWRSDLFMACAEHAALVEHYELGFATCTRSAT